MIYFGLVIAVLVLGLITLVFRALRQRQAQRRFQTAVAALELRATQLRKKMKTAADRFQDAANRVESGDILRDNEEESPEFEQAPPDSVPFDPHLFAVLRLLAAKIRTLEARHHELTATSWAEYEHTFTQFRQTGDDRILQMIELQLDQLDHQLGRLEALTDRLSFDAQQELLDRYQRQVLDPRAHVVHEIDLVRSVLARDLPGLLVTEVMQQELQGILDTFDHEVKSERAWSQAHQFADKAVAEVKRFLDRQRQRAVRRATLVPKISLFQSALGTIQARLDEMVKAGYQPAAGSVEATMQPLRAEFTAWNQIYNLQCETSIELHDIELQKLVTKLEKFDEHHDRLWKFYLERNERRSHFTSARHMLEHRLQVIRRNRAADTSSDALRADLDARMETLVTKARQFSDGSLSSFCSIMGTRAEAELASLHKGYNELMRELTELGGYAEMSTARLRSQTGSFKVPAKV